jgi:aminoglycoside 6'-N-acetyltransferase I
MQSGPTLRQATIADAGVALPLIERFFAEEGFHAPPGQMRRQLLGLLGDDESAVFLAWQGEEAVGVATVTTTSGIELGLSAEMEDLYVLPAARGLGVGAALIKRVKGWCRAKGCSLVSVIVTPEGQAAHDLVGYYRRRGFVETGRTILFAHLQAPGATNPVDER